MEKAVDYFLSGYSCSESIVKAAIDKGLIHSSLLSVATSFSGGMGSGCLCGAVSGSQIVIGSLYGKNEAENIDGQKARLLAKKVVEEFKKRNKFTCCKVLTSGLDMHSKERKLHCIKMVQDCAEILEEILQSEKKAVEL